MELTHFNEKSIILHTKVKLARCKMILACLFIFTNVALSFSQVNASSFQSQSFIRTHWIVGLGTNIVDDGGDIFENLFSIDQEWSVVPYPSRISIGSYFYSGLGLEVITTINKYKAGTLVQRNILNEDINYFAIDLRFSYDLYKLIGENRWFDPYLGVGLGYADANKIERKTFNASIGSRFWLNDLWGIDVSSTGKWALNNEASNHLQHAVGVVYRFGLSRYFNRSK